ncbi:MAG TPA: tetratricopeptide repeat protein [Polyangiaceae bacterium]|nr:tetratricopeptide repeat protein [Polyangiaceae bacterium]
MTRFLTPKGGRAAESLPNPERLTEGKFGRLLQDGNRELAEGLDQSAAFQRLSERMATSPAAGGGRRVYWLVPAFAVALAAFAVVPALVTRMRAPSGPLIVAEDLRGHREPPVASAVATERSPAAPAREVMRPGDGRSALSAKHSGRAPSTASSLSEPASAVAPSVDPAPVPPSPTPAPAGSTPDVSASATPPQAAEVSAGPDCLSLARGGHTRDAEACFLKRAEGSGLGAEMALYEVARLRRDVLGDAPGALRVLAEYRTRFPSGSLRREADMSQLELLVQLGRTDEALKQSDELLSSSASGERAAELHLLRGHILRKTRSRFAEAAHEYELAERAGARRGDVTYFHALCLEALGRGPEAAALFTQYLEQPQHSYAEDARRRLERLKP